MFKCPSVNSHRIGTGYYGIAPFYTGGIATGWAVFHEDVSSVQNGQGRFDHDTEIGYDFMNILMKLVASSSQQTVPVFESQRSLAKIMIFNW